jgi:hypothetical protein
MDTRETRFETVCRLLNKVLEDRTNTPTEFALEKDEVDILVAALSYYRETIDPNSGDVIATAEFRCPSCGSCEEFRGQDNQVSNENTHLAVGVEVIKVHGIAQCNECKTQIRVAQFQPIKLDGFDQKGWEDLYLEKYQEHEQAVKLDPIT